MGSKVRSSDLETGLSSSAGTARAKTDTTTSMPSFVPSSSRPSVPGQQASLQVTQSNHAL